jgi:tetratricopeptide (TPR) repeat protein
MSVLIEALNVVVRVETLETRYPGGVAAYRADCPNATFCSDEYLTRVGFMSPVDVRAFAEALEAHFGLTSLTDIGEFADVAVVDQHIGPTVACSWIQFDSGPEGLSRCWLAGTAPGELAFPESWSSEIHSSLSFIPNEDMPGLLIERAENVDRILDAKSGGIKYVDRPFPDLQAVQDLYRRGKLHEETGDLVEASHLYEAALRLRPDKAYLWYVSGVLRAKVDSESAAIPFYEKALRLEPELQMAAANLGTALSSIGRLDEALAWLRKAVELDPGDPIARWNLATTLEKTQSPESGEAFRKFIEVAEATQSPSQGLESAVRYATPRAAPSAPVGYNEVPNPELVATVQRSSSHKGPETTSGFVDRWRAWRDRNFTNPAIGGEDETGTRNQVPHRG